MRFFFSNDGIRNMEWFVIPVVFGHVTFQADASVRLMRASGISLNWCPTCYLIASITFFGSKIRKITLRYKSFIEPKLCILSEKDEPPW